MDPTGLWSWSPMEVLKNALAKAKLASQPTGKKLVVEPGKPVTLDNGANAVTFLLPLGICDHAANQWTEVTPGGLLPSARSGHAMVCDPTSGDIVVYGGWTDSAGFLFDMWQYQRGAH